MKLFGCVEKRRTCAVALSGNRARCEVRGWPASAHLSRSGLCAEGLRRTTLQPTTEMCRVFMALAAKRCGHKRFRVASPRGQREQLSPSSKHGPIQMCMRAACVDVCPKTSWPSLKWLADSPIGFIFIVWAVRFRAAVKVGFCAGKAWRCASRSGEKASACGAAPYAASRAAEPQGGASRARYAARGYAVLA